MNFKGIFFVLAAIILTLPSGRILAQARKHAPTTAYPSYKGMIMAGYQGWFRAPADGVMYPDEKQVRIDMWPDVREYEKTYPTGLKLADGSTARFFSSTDKSTVDLHFKWMQEYGLSISVLSLLCTIFRDSASREKTAQAS